jgi:hypothetical protein
LFVAAGSDRDRVLSAPLAADGSVIGLTYAEAGRLESSANDKATAGAAMIGVGAAAAGAGLLWWLLSAR